MIWHWRHHAYSNAGCQMRLGGESWWHLDMKRRHLDLGFEIEYEVELENGRCLRFDAFDSTKEKPIREAIHSLSSLYDDKSRVLHTAKVSHAVCWIFDGDEFVSERRAGIKKNGYRKLLKPNAWDTAAVFAYYKQTVIVDWNGGYKLWKDNVWFPLESDELCKVMT